MASGTQTESKIDRVRQELPGVLATGYFNAGTFGPIPRVAFEEAMALSGADFELGRISPGVYERSKERNLAAAAIAAEILGADPDEIALTHSTCEGLNSALMGMTWNVGDEIVTTSEEHPGLLSPLSMLARRFGVVNRIAHVGNGGSHVVEALAQQITSRTRVIALSHLLWSTGAVLPLREISELAREHELLVIVDAAQSAGQIPINLHDLGVDAYAMAGQKWLCGPEGTGFLYIKRDRFVDFLPTFVRYGQSEMSGFYMPPVGAARYEIGEFSGPAIAAQTATLRWLRDDVGLDWAYARTANLGARFHRLLSNTDGVEVITPAHAMAGMVNFNVVGMHPKEVSAALLEQGFTIRYVDSRPCLVSARASISWWNTEAEVDDLAQEVGKLASSSKTS